MLKNKVDKIGIVFVLLLILIVVWNLSVNRQGELMPSDVAKMLGIGGLCLLMFSFETHANPARTIKPVVFVSSLICFGLSLLFWVAILFDLLWGG